MEYFDALGIAWLGTEGLEVVLAAAIERGWKIAEIDLGGDLCLIEIDAPGAGAGDAGAVDGADAGDVVGEEEGAAWTLVAIEVVGVHDGV